MLPISSFDERLQLIERASARHPDNPDLLTIRAEFFLTVGRLNEAIDAARRAVETRVFTDLVAELEKTWSGVVREHATASATGGTRYPTAP